MTCLGRIEFSSGTRPTGEHFASLPRLCSRIVMELPMLKETLRQAILVLIRHEFCRKRFEIFDASNRFLRSIGERALAVSNLRDGSGICRILVVSQRSKEVSIGSVAGEKQSGPFNICARLAESRYGRDFGENRKQTIFLRRRHFSCKPRSVRRISKGPQSQCTSPSGSGSDSESQAMPRDTFHSPFHLLINFSK